MVSARSSSSTTGVLLNDSTTTTTTAAAAANATTNKSVKVDEEQEANHSSAAAAAPIPHDEVEVVEGNDDEEADEDDEVDASAGAADKKSKKKKKKRKKKSAASTTKDEASDASAAAAGAGAPHKKIQQQPSKRPPHLGLKDTAFTDSYVKYGQTDPPTIPISELFRGQEFPTGEILPHPGSASSQTYRETSEEVRARDRLHEDMYSKVREAAEVHRQVRSYAQGFMKPGIKLTDMCEQLENKNRELVQERGLERGIAFPTGCSLNYVAAHYSPNTGDDTVLKYDDVMKVRNNMCGVFAIVGLLVCLCSAPSPPPLTLFLFKKLFVARSCVCNK